MDLLEEGLANYIEDYFSRVIDEASRRQKLIGIAQYVMREKIAAWGFPDLLGMHRTLEEILDNHQHSSSVPSFITEPESGNTIRDGCGLQTVLPENFTLGIEPLERGEELLDALRQAMPETELESLLRQLGGREQALYLLDRSSLTAKDIMKGALLMEDIAWLNALPAESINLYGLYDGFRRGKSHYNPIQIINSVSLPIIRRAILDLHQQGHIKDVHGRLVSLGFNSIMKASGGSAGVVRQAAPELLNEIPGIHKWMFGSDSIQIALGAIQKVLFKLPRYRVAEETYDRDAQVRIVTEWVRKEKRLQEAFEREGLSGLMTCFIDTEGVLGFTRNSSPKAMLEFYSLRKGLNWFDRSQDNYVPLWLIRERGMWQRGEQSARLAVNAISDIIYWALPGYREAEKDGKRDDMVRMLYPLVESGELIRLLKTYVYGMIQSLVDPEGKVGFRKQMSLKSVLDFYSERKGLQLFDRAQEIHIPEWLIKMNGMWLRGEESAMLGVAAIEDTLYGIPKYMSAEKTGDRYGQLKAIDEFGEKIAGLSFYFRKKVGSIMQKLRTIEGKTGPRTYSLSSLFEFYSNRKGLEWFDKNKYPHMLQRRNHLIFVYLA